LSPESSFDKIRDNSSRAWPVSSAIGPAAGDEPPTGG
jgi:hypothetical protein